MHPVRNEAGAIENFIAMLADITARVETENYLRHAKEEADAASRAKSEFLASMSHEIRTPMNGVIGMTSLLLETPLSADQLDCVNTIRTSGDALLAIINDILDFSKIESGKMELEQRPFELAPCLEEALDLFAVQAAAKRIDLAYFVEPEVPAWIVSDPTRLRQVVVNFVNNAVKFTPHGRVSLEVGLADASRPPMRAGATSAAARTDVPWTDEAGTCLLEVAIRDTGIGIPPEKQQRLFQPFSQVDSSTTRKYGGTGLGLVICRRLCELMGGYIRVESTPGHGSVFTFTIQVRPASPPAAVPRVLLPVSLQGRPVLVVDDHAASARFLSITLGGAGLACQTADSPMAALELVKRGPPPALFIVNQVPPDREGRNLVAELRRRAGRPPPPVLLLLPTGEPVPRPWLDELAPAAHLLKPLKVGPLLSAIRSLFVPATAPDDTTSPRPRLLSDDIPLDILLVEDNPVNQTVALSLLGRLGYKPDSVISGVAALSMIEQHSYQLILMDVQMPEMNGFECTKEIRRRLPPDRQPCIVAVTANALIGDRELCLDAGMNDYLTKPLKLDLLASVIRRSFPAKTAA
jgi:signal transduction histidine kinase/CheY-like chemotaxis protein